jgi:hypothetical protein
MIEARCAQPARCGLRRIVIGLSVAGVVATLGLTGGMYAFHAVQATAVVGQTPQHPMLLERPLQKGDLAPDFTLRDLEHCQVRLSDYRGRMPVIIEFGSMSCPIVTGRVAQIDALAQNYRGKIEFLFVYGSEAHPGHGETISSSYGTFQALPEVRDYGERCERAQQFRGAVHTSRRILVDEDGADSVTARYGIAGFGFVVVDMQGRIYEVSAGPHAAADFNKLLGNPSSGAAGVETPPGTHL